MSDEYLIWSNEHQGWWGPDGCGYDSGYDHAGRYSRQHAIEVCQRALPTAMHIGMISEIPVRIADFEDVLRGQMVPASVLQNQRRGSR